MVLSRRQLLQYGSIGIASSAFPQIALAKAHSDLQIKLNQLVKRQRSAGLVSGNEKTAWVVHDLHANKNLVSINGNRAMQAASMVKVFVALAYFYLHQQAPHKYPYHSKQRHLMELMLVKSSNDATNQLMKLCRGPANVRRLCQKASKNRFTHLRIVEYIPAGGRTYKNKASAQDYNRYLYDLWQNRLPSSKEIKRIMSMDNQDRIETSTMRSNLTIYDKTGSTGMLCGDMGVVQLGRSNKAYTFVGIIEKSRKARNYSRWISDRSDVMREVSELVYQSMVARYGLSQ